MHKRLLVGLATLTVINGTAHAAHAALSFRQHLIELARDRVVDRLEFKKLASTARGVQSADPDSDDAVLAADVMQFLEEQKEAVELTYRLPSMGTERERELTFTFVPTYSESDPVAGRNAREIVANISQADTLEDTHNDDNRCGTATLISSYLLLGGTFETVSKLIGLPAHQRQLSYENIHRAQEELYLFADTNDEEGITAGFTYGVAPNGKIVEIAPTDEMKRAADKIKLKLYPILGETDKTKYQREKALQLFWSKYPQAVLQVGVYLDESTGTVVAPTASRDQNHFVVVFRDRGKLYLINTGVLNNGDGSALKEMTDKEIRTMLYTSDGTLNGILLAR